MNTEDSTTAKALPFNDMPKHDMEKHLINAHRFYIGSAVGSRWSKERAIEFHDKFHQDHKDPEVRNAHWAFDHEHEQVEQDPEQQKRFEQVLNGALPDKPLSASERKVLKELVDNDFNRLKSEMRQFSADALNVALAEVKAEWESKVEDGPRYVARMDEIITRAREEASLLVEEAKTNGIAVNGIDVYSRREGGYRVIGRDEALSKVMHEHQATLDRALLTLDQQRLATQRIVMLSGVSAESRKLLDTLPTARTAMVEASQAEQNVKQINA